MNQTSIPTELPTSEQLQEELNRELHKHRYNSALRSTVYTLITVAAIAVLVATLLIPVLQIYGNSMTPTLQEGETVLSLKGAEFNTGDIIAFYYNNKILVKRVIAGPGTWVDIDADGVVYINGTELDEPYVSELSLGECNIGLPYQVPDERYFVMGDHRSTSVDSRHAELGCVAEEQIVGKIIFRLWPFSRFGFIEAAA